MMRSQLLIFICVAFLSALASASECRDIEGTWWLSTSRSGFWAKNEISVSGDCQEITIKKFTGGTNIPAKKEILQYGVQPEWVFVRRWKADSDGQWYSYYKRITWDNGVFVRQYRLFRERDGALAWDISHKVRHEGDKLYDSSLYRFPIDKREQKFESVFLNEFPKR